MNFAFVNLFVCILNNLVSQQICCRFAGFFLFPSICSYTMNKSHVVLVNRLFTLLACTVHRNRQEKVCDCVLR